MEIKKILENIFEIQREGEMNVPVKIYASEKILEDIKKNFSKGMIILFGSYAKGIPKRDSDIDIYLETNDNNIKTRVKETNSKLSIKIGKFDTKFLLIKEIIKNHIIIRGLEDFYERVEFFEEA